MKVIKVEAGKKPFVKEIDSGLESLQNEVDGYIECVYPWEDNACIICNEEGKINGMSLNRALKDENGCIYDIIAGSFLVVALEVDDGGFDSLTDEQVETYKSIFDKPEMFLSVNGRIRVIKLD